MKDKVVLITGGATGIGYATAIKFLSLGAHVIIAGRNETAGQAAVAELMKLGRKVSFIQSNVAQSVSVKNLIQKIADDFGRLDIAFNNAGVEGTFQEITDATEEELNSVIDINLKGTWLACKFESEQMIKQRHGVIVNTSSWLSQGALVGSSIYSASKAGVDGMMRALAVELAPHHIRINNINPGYVITPMFRRFFDPETEAGLRLKKHVPLNRLGQPEEIANLVVWLCGKEASYVTGQTYLIDGGLTIAGQR